MWHPGLQTGVDIIEADKTASVAEQANWLRVTLDIERSEPGNFAALKVIGIEDLIIEQVRLGFLDGGLSRETMLRLQALMGLASEGVCGPLRTNYLRRRLAHDTHVEVCVDTTPSDEGWAHRFTPRTLNLTEILARINVWRDRHGLSPGPLNARDPDRICHANGRMMMRNDSPVREHRRGCSLAEILPFDSAILIPPG